MVSSAPTAMSPDGLIQPNGTSGPTVEQMLIGMSRDSTPTNEMSLFSLFQLLAVPLIFGTAPVSHEPTT